MVGMKTKEWGGGGCSFNWIDFLLGKQSLLSDSMKAGRSLRDQLTRETPSETKD